MAPKLCPCYNYTTLPIALVYRGMMTTQDRSAFNRRLVLYTALLAGVILVGVGLFFLFAGTTRPLLDLGFNFTTTTTT